jgi:anti-sigma B factor antagonist
VPGVRFPVTINGIPVVTSPAEIDIITAGQLRTVLLHSVAHGQATIVVDMTGTTFCDSAGFSVLVRAHKQTLAEGGGLRLVIPADSAVARSFTLTGLDRVIPRFTSLDHALAPGPGPAIRPLRPPPPARSTAGGATVISMPSGAGFSQQLIRSYTQVVFNERQIGRAAEFFAPDVTWQGSTGPVLHGRDRVIALIGEVLGALDGLTATEQDMIAHADIVSARYRIEATHSRVLFGVPATGRPIRWEPASTYRIADGKIVNAVTSGNLASILRHVGRSP